MAVSWPVISATPKNSSSSESASWLTIVASVTVVATAAMILRTVKRSFSPVICSKLQCRCGQVQGRVCAKREDSMRIWCFCKDCQQYAKFVADQGRKKVNDENDKKEAISSNNTSNADTILGPYGESRIVQVCKSDVFIDKGQNLLQLCRKWPEDSSKKKKGEIYMHRYYTKCCHVPIYQTIDFLGFVGIVTNNLDGEHEKFDGPVAVLPEYAWKAPPTSLKNISMISFFWRLVRYHSYRKLGPFDYDQQPTYWGGTDFLKEKNPNKML